MSLPVGPIVGRALHTLNTGDWGCERAYMAIGEGAHLHMNANLLFAMNCDALLVTDVQPIHDSDALGDTKYNYMHRRIDVTHNKISK